MYSNLSFNDLSTKLKITEVENNFFGHLRVQFVGKREDINLFKIYEAYHEGFPCCYGTTYIAYSDTGILAKSLGKPCLEVFHIDNVADIDSLSKCKTTRYPLSSTRSIVPFLDSLELRYPKIWRRVSTESFNSNRALHQHQQITLTSGDLVTEAMILKILSVEALDDTNFKYTAITETLDIYHEDFIGHDAVLDKLWTYREYRFLNKNKSKNS